MYVQATGFVVFKAVDIIYRDILSISYKIHTKVVIVLVFMF